MKELYISGKRVDLFKEELIATSYQVSKIAEIRDAQAFFSNRFTVPTTNNNNKIFGFANNIGSTTVRPYRILPCRYIQNGVDLLEDGAAVIYNCQGGAYNIEVYSGLYDFFSQLGDKTLTELDLSALDFVFTAENVVSANNGSGPVTYPLIDFGAFGPGPIETIDIRYQEPSIKAWYILEKIFEGTNWNKSGEIFTDPKFLDLSLSLTGDPLIDSEDVNESRSFRVGTAGYSRTGQNSRYSVLALGKYDDLTGDNYDSTAGWLDKTNPNAWKYTARVDCLVQVTFNVFAAPSSMGPMYLSKNGIPPFFGGFSAVWSSTGIPNSPLLSTTTPQIKLLPGESLFLHTYTSSGLLTTNYYPDGNIISDPENKSFIEFKVINSSVVGGTISFTGKLPDMKQVDFVRNMANIFGMIMQPKNDTREILFKQFKRIRSDGKIKDLSKKIDLSQPPEISFHPDGYFQNNFMRWIQADARGVIGDASFPINDTTLERNGDLFVLDFASSLQKLPIIENHIGIMIPRFKQAEAPTYTNNKAYVKNELVNYAGTVWIMINNSPQTNVTPGSDGTVWEVYFDQYEFSESTDPHLIYTRKVTLSTPISITDTTGTPIEVSEWPVAWFSDSSQLYSLDFNFLIENEYKPIVEMMQLFKQVVVYLLLTELDIMTLDFFSMVYIEYFGEKFYLDLVSEFLDSTQSTACTLTRI